MKRDGARDAVRQNAHYVRAAGDVLGSRGGVPVSFSFIEDATACR